MFNSNLKTIVLFDSNLTLNDIQKFLGKSDTLIITFDFNSHKLLYENKIPHVISDDWINEKELQNIQEHVYKFSYWFEHDDINSKLIYDGINLGELISSDLLYLLPKFLTSCLKLQKIFSQYDKCNFFAIHLLYDIINKLTPTSFAIKSKPVVSNSDKIQYNVSIFNKNISLRLSTKQYLSTKKYIENILNHFMISKLPAKNNLLLVNFHTERYISLFEESKNKFVQLYVYNTMMPSFWNFNTISKIKRSQCKIIGDSTFPEDVKTKHKVKIQELQEECKKLWENESFFESFFVYEKIPIWTLFKDYFLNLYQNMISNCIPQIEKIKSIFEKYKITNVLIWSETNPTDIIFLQLRNKYGYKVFKLQHGYYPESKISYNFCNAYRIYGLKSDKFFVWGESPKSYYIKHGFSDDKIIPIGSIHHDPVFKKIKSTTTNGYILLGTTTPTGIFADELTISIKNDYVNSLKTICKEISKFNKKLIVKLHPASDQMNLTPIFHEIDPTIPIFSRGELQDLLSNCELYISTGVSTSILDAFIFNKPVINIQTKRHDLGHHEILDYVLNTNPEKFDETLKKLLTDKSLRNSLIKNENEYLKKYFSNPGNAASNLMNYLNSI